MTTCLVSEIECLGYSEHNGIGFLLASTAEHKTVESEEQRERGGRGRGEGERGGGTGMLYMCTTFIGSNSL